MVSHKPCSQGIALRIYKYCKNIKEKRNRAVLAREHAAFQMQRPKNKLIVFHLELLSSAWLVDLGLRVIVGLRIAIHLSFLWGQLLCRTHFLLCA